MITAIDKTSAILFQSGSAGTPVIELDPKKY